MASGITAIVSAIYGHLVDQALNGAGFQSILTVWDYGWFCHFLAIGLSGMA